MKIHAMTMWGMFSAVLLCGCISTQPEVRPLPEIKKGTDEDLISRWKVQAVTVADVEVGKTKYDKPSGTEWEKFKAGLRAGDELWYFCSPGKTWEELMGWRGYVIFRNGRLVAHYTTAEN
jgi:hypothetical protein